MQLQKLNFLSPFILRNRERKKFEIKIPKSARQSGKKSKNRNKKKKIKPTKTIKPKNQSGLGCFQPCLKPQLHFTRP